MGDILKIGEARVVNGSQYRQLCEVVFLMEQAWDAKDVSMLRVAMKKARELANELKKGDFTNGQNAVSNATSVQSDTQSGNS